MVSLRLLHDKDLRFYEIILRTIRNLDDRPESKYYGIYTCYIQLELELLKKKKTFPVSKLGQWKKNIIRRFSSIVSNPDIVCTCSYFYLKSNPRIDLFVSDYTFSKYLESNILYAGCNTFPKKHKKRLLEFQRYFLAALLTAIFASQFYAFANEAGINNAHKRMLFPSRLVQRYLLFPKNIQYGETGKTEHELRKAEKHYFACRGITFSTEYSASRTIQIIYVYYKSTVFSYCIPILQTEDSDWSSDSVSTISNYESSLDIVQSDNSN